MMRVGLLSKVHNVTLSAAAAQQQQLADIRALQSRVALQLCGTELDRYVDFMAAAESVDPDDNLPDYAVR